MVIWKELSWGHVTVFEFLKQYEWNLGTVELLNMQVRNKVYWKTYIWVRFCVNTLAVFENVFDITVFVNSMTMHFQNNLYMLFMTMLNVKKMFYILYVQKLKWTSFFVLSNDFEIKNTICPNHSLHFTTVPHHNIWSTQHFVNATQNEL